MSDPIAMPSDQSDDEFAVPEEASEDENTDEDDWMLSPDENDIDLPEVGMDVPVPAAEKPASTSEAKPTIQSESAPKWGPRTDPAFLAYLKAAMRKPVSMVQTSNASLADPKPPSLPPPSVQHPPAAAKAKPKTSVDPTPAIRKPIQTTVIPSGARDTSRLQEIRSIAPEPPTDSEIACLICSNRHVPGHCPLREIQPQQCPLCGFHHIHHRRTCPLLADLDAVKEIQKKLKESTEDRAVLDAAVTFIRGVKGGLDRKKKKEST
jgi:Chromatin remodeling factor Mit1 C-terminal Zn finger 2